MEKIKVGIIGYGNLGKALHKRINLSREMKVAVVFSRRAESVSRECNAVVDSIENTRLYKEKIDVMALAVGSANDLLPIALKQAVLFNTIDAYDDHAKMSEYSLSLDNVAKQSGRLALYACGWDPGLMSLARGLFESVLPYGKSCSLWGKGVSQGHTQAIKEIEGVTQAVQYTIPFGKISKKADKGIISSNLPENNHKRICYVSVEEGADKKEIAERIKEMPDYFEPYDVKVIFCNRKKVDKLKNDMYHKGRVIRVCEETGSLLEFDLSMQSNPDLTASVMAAYIPAMMRLKARGETGAKNVFDCPLSLVNTMYSRNI